MSYKSVLQECPRRVSHKSVLQECHLDICSFSIVFPFGFVGSILFLSIHLDGFGMTCMFFSPAICQEVLAHLLLAESRLYTHDLSESMELVARAQGMMESPEIVFWLSLCHTNSDCLMFPCLGLE